MFWNNKILDYPWDMRGEGAKLPSKTYKQLSYTDYNTPHPPPREKWFTLMNGATNLGGL